MTARQEVGSSNLYDQSARWVSTLAGIDDRGLSVESRARRRSARSVIEPSPPPSQGLREFLPAAGTPALRDRAGHAPARISLPWRGSSSSNCPRLEASTPASAITSEAATRAAADTTNAIAITAEATTARAAESAKATATTTEATTARAAEATKRPLITTTAANTGGYTAAAWELGSPTPLRRASRPLCPRALRRVLRLMFAAWRWWNQRRQCRQRWIGHHQRGYHRSHARSR
jgi:hypothetical protein